MSAVILRWLNKHDNRSYTMTNTTKLNPNLFTGTPESYFAVLNNAPADKFPIDAIDCAVGRAVATVALVHIGLTVNTRVHDLVITDALWGVQSQLDLIQKLADHYNVGSIVEAARAVSSTLDLIMMSMGNGVFPSDGVISSTLDCALMAIGKIKTLANQEYELQKAA